MLFLVILLSLSLAERENGHFLENPEHSLLSKDENVIIGAVFSIYSGTQMQSLLHTEKLQPLICFRFVVVENLMLQSPPGNLYCISALNYFSFHILDTVRHFILFLLLLCTFVVLTSENSTFLRSLPLQFMKSTEATA